MRPVQWVRDGTLGLRAVIPRARRSGFAQHALVLTVGTGTSQAIGIATAPVLSRIYAPPAFGVLVTYMAISATLAIPATGRYETAILLPGDDGEGAELTALTIVLTLLSTLLALLIVAGYALFRALVMPALEMAAFLYAIPLLVLLQGLYQALYYWCNRRQRYLRMAASRVLQACCVAGVSILLGVFWPRPESLLVGLVCGQAASVILLGVTVWQRDRRTFRSVVRQSLWAQAYKYRHFPMYCAPGEALNALATWSPVFLLSAMFGPWVVGLFSLPQRVLTVPITMIGNAVQDVFRQRASRELAEQGDCRRLFAMTTAALAVVAVPPFLGMQFAAPLLFSKVFGMPWAEAGRFAQIMAILFFLRFVVGPVSSTIVLAQRQRYQFVWQAGLLLVTTLSVAVGGWFRRPDLAVLLYTLSYSAMYVWCFAVAYGSTRGRAARHGGAAVLPELVAIETDE